MIVELYRFAIGAEVHLYTTSQQPVTYQGETYQPTYVRKEGGHGTESTARTALKIWLPRDAGIVTRFAPGPPSQIVEAEVYQQDENSTALIYLGRVLNVASKGSEATLNCESIHTSLRSAGLRRRHQILCPYALYDSECGVDPADFRVPATLTAATASTLSADAFAGKPDGWFRGGFVTWGPLPEQRAIVAHTGDTITLASPLSGPEAGDAVDAFAGCDHTFSTCKDKFDNGINHGGMPWLPAKNPFSDDPIF